MEKASFRRSSSGHANGRQPPDLRSELTPAQVRSIADFTEMKIIDRTQVILISLPNGHTAGRKDPGGTGPAEICCRAWRPNTPPCPFDRGIGARGPGETKLEITGGGFGTGFTPGNTDERIEKARGQRRIKRERTGLPIISIVGYTNAGNLTS